jgi:flagellar basal-body rod protein FlgB
MHITTLLSDQIARYLDLSNLELKLTAQNMANLDTPGYRTVGIDFAQEMERSLGEVAEERRQEADSGAKRSRLAGPAVAKVDGLLDRPDGNNVSMDREGLKMSEAQLQFRIGVTLIRNEFNGILDAIHADSK